MKLRARRDVTRQDVSKVTGTCVFQLEMSEEELAKLPEEVRKL